MPFPVAARLSWADVPSSVVTNTVSSVVARGVGVTVVTGPAEGPVATGEDDTHSSGLEEVLIGYSTNKFSKLFERNLHDSTSR